MKLNNGMNRIYKSCFSKSISKITLNYLFEKYFEEHKNNMKKVVSDFERLNLHDKFHLKCHFIQGLEKKVQIYQDSKAVDWLLNNKNISSIIADVFCKDAHIQLKQLSEIMILTKNNPDDVITRKVIGKMKELLPLVNDRENLDWVLKTVDSVKSVPSSRWSSVDSIFELEEIELLEKSTRSERTANQNVRMFSLIKEFDLSTLSQLEIDLLNLIMENIQNVDPALYLKLVYDLVSHFLFELSSKKIGGQKIYRVLDSASLAELKKEIPTLELFEKLIELNYNPKNFSPKKLMKMISLSKPLTSPAFLSFYELFPKLAD